MQRVMTDVFSVAEVMGVAGVPVHREEEVGDSAVSAALADVVPETR